MGDFSFIDRQRTHELSPFTLTSDAEVYYVPMKAGNHAFLVASHPSDDFIRAKLHAAQQRRVAFGSVMPATKLSAAVQAGSSHRPIFFRRSEIIIGYAHDSPQVRREIMKDYDLLTQFYDSRGSFGLYSLTKGDTVSLLARLESDDRIDFAEVNVLDGIEDEILELDDVEGGVSKNTFEDPLWHHITIDMDEPSTVMDGRGVTIAVVDGLFNKQHQAVADALLDPTLDLRFDDNLSNRPHGLAVASAAVGQVKLPNGYFLGIAPGAKLLPVAISTIGTSSYPKRAVAINYLAEIARKRSLATAEGRLHNVERMIVNCSWQLRSTVDLTSIRRSFEKLESSGAVCVCSAGNDGTNERHYPSDYGNNISVGSVARNGEASSFSNWGERVTLSAPGGDGDPMDTGDILLASDPDGLFFHWGTSFASPCVAGILATYWSRNLDATAAEVISFAQSDVAKPYQRPDVERPLGAGIASFRNAKSRVASNQRSAEMFRMYGRPIFDAVASGNLDQMRKVLAASEFLMSQRDDAEAGTDEAKEWDAAHRELIKAIAEKESIKLSKQSIVAIRDGIVVIDNIALARQLKQVLESDEEGPWVKVEFGWS